MTITQLQYVLAVAEHKNFTLAAEKSFVTQPTLSMQIQKLEDELDILIFDRSKKPIQLTQVGEKIVDQARNIVNESFRIKDIVDQEKGYIGGEYRLGIIPTIMPTLLPLFLKNFVKKYPKINLKVEERNTDTLIEMLEEGYLDAAIAATPLENSNIKERPLYYEPFVAYVPESHRLSNTANLKVEDLNLDDILLLEDGHCFREGVINLCKSNHEAGGKPFELASGSFETMLKLADEGMGMTLLPYLHTLDLKEKQKANLYYFEDPKPAREVSIIYHKSELKMHITEALKETISGIVRGAIAFQNVQIISPLNK
ncbi:LysR family transcriptional regulator [Robertkochia marina]|uniref:LysR family transcriptional regulator n=1 Tax=Robertkochia marina TaxID=1227945 RepID=A0A4V3UY78_9FLAO|nr:LysR substrate-binding domain-containing protein [Robertkochia marina]THD68026.1 LysR family transcriptional regulator [Robertkochia marina]TRZ42689.1 LysR family transcriptional regulator [Robertkochia marina]